VRRKWPKASATFDLTWRGVSVLDWRGSHAALRGGKASHNFLYAEFQACEAFGVDPDLYLRKDRDTRKAMTGYVYGRDLLAALSAYEAHEEAKKKRP